jgi:hypothetical protein
MSIIKAGARGHDRQRAVELLVDSNDLLSHCDELLSSFQLLGYVWRQLIFKAAVIFY